MSTKTVETHLLVCDRCRKETKKPIPFSEHGLIVLTFEYGEIVDLSKDYNALLKIDLCLPCTKSFKEFMLGNSTGGIR